MTVTAEIIIAEFEPKDVRQLALDLGVPVSIQEDVLRSLGEMAETEFLAAYCAAVTNELEDAGVPVSAFVRAIHSGKRVLEDRAKEMER